MEKKYYIVVCNLKNSICFELPVNVQENNYARFYKNSLKHNIPLKLYEKLIKKGLFLNLSVGNNSNNSECTIHRLVACLYYNCLGKEIHHISKNKTENHICNLIPVSKKLHIQLDNIDMESNLYNSELVQIELLKKLKSRMTLAKNDELIYEILGDLTNGFTISELIQKYKSKIKKSTIYNLVAKYILFGDFIIWLKSHALTCNEELNGKLSSNWDNIIHFEQAKNQVWRGNKAS